MPFRQDSSDDCLSDQRMWVEMHWPWEEGLAIPWGDSRDSHAPDTLQRPHFWKSLIITNPIDRTARRVSCNNESNICPYCKKIFRNPAALKLHCEEGHGLETAIELFGDLVGRDEQSKL